MKNESKLHPSIVAYLAGIPKEIKAARENSDFLFFVDRVREEFKDSYMHGWTYPQIRNVEMAFQFAKFSEAKRLLRFLAQNGYKRVGKVVELKEAQCMIWTFDRFTIKGFFRKEESACHYVQVGTKMVETPIYELRCPETIDPAFAPATTVQEVDADGLPF